MKFTSVRLFLVLALLSLLLSGAAVVLGQETAIDRAPPSDPVLEWAVNATFVVVICAAALVLYTLVFRRNHLMESSSKWTLFLGLCILPLPVAFLTAGIGMEETKQVEFCHSCHEPMHPFVDDLKNPESDTLAARHYKSQFIRSEHCWQCHSDYGVGGTVSAKMTGMVHMWKYSTDSWEAPIHLYHDYNWNICLGCHRNSSLFERPRNDEEAHSDVMQELLSGEIGCTECHDMAHPPREERGEK